MNIRDSNIPLLYFILTLIIDIYIFLSFFMSKITYDDVPSIALPLGYQTGMYIIFSFMSGAMNSPPPMHTEYAPEHMISVVFAAVLEGLGFKPHPP